MVSNITTATEYEAGINYIRAICIIFKNWFPKFQYHTKCYDKYKKGDYRESQVQNKKKPNSILLLKHRIKLPLHFIFQKNSYYALDLNPTEYYKI